MKTLNTKEDIQKWLDDMGIKNYSITKNLVVNVKGNVFLANNKLKNIPVQFGVVTGDFIVSMNSLTSLKGSPNKVEGDFYCSDNKLETLEYSPKTVGGNFYCEFNLLDNLEGAPEKVGGSFHHYGNPLRTEKLNTKVVGLIIGNDEWEKY